MALRALAAAAAVCLLCGAARADCPAPTAEAPLTAASGQALPPDALRAQSVSLEGRCLAFHTLAGSLAGGENGVAIAYVAYLLDGAEPSRRPVVFAVNGGPGAGSVWLQLGALGPWRLPMQGLAPSSAPALVANAETWLDFADLVFLDPPGTGYGQPHDARAAERAGVWTVGGDLDALAEGVRRWLVDHGRLGSPKFIAGESYGGFRAPKLAKRLTSELGIGVSGVVLLSPVLDFARFVAGPENPFAYLTRLPSYAATAREAKGPVARADLTDAESYATGDYLADWLAGPGDRDGVERRVKRVAALTGLSEDVVRRYGGDLSEHDFLREKGRQEDAKLAFYDATLKAGATGPGWPEAEDPVLPGFVPALTSAITLLYRDRLGWRVEPPYETLNDEVNGHWNWGGALNPPEALGDLAQDLALDPHFRALVVHGLTDVQAPYFASVLELRRLPALADPGRLKLLTLPGGHMFYGRDESRKALRDAAKALVEGAVIREPAYGIAFIA